MNKKILEGLEPFNQFQYANCFLHAFYPVVQYYNRSLTPYILNSLFYYATDTDDLICCKEIIFDARDRVAILNAQGIAEISDIPFEGIIERIEYAIDRERPAIAGIDCFYEEVRSDTYNQVHALHFVLIYGYDRDKKVFYILEHDFLNSYKYNRRQISYKCFIRAFNGSFLLNDIGTRFSSYYEYHPAENYSMYDKTAEDRENISRYRRLIGEKIKDITGRVGIILSFGDYIRKKAENGELIDHVDYLLTRLNEIIEVKKRERYVLSKYMEAEKNILEQFDYNLNNIQVLRGLLIKYRFINEPYNEAVLESIMNRLKLFYDGETGLYRMIAEELVPQGDVLYG